MTYRIGAISRIDPSAVKKKPHSGWCFALTLTKSVHELAEGSGALDLEEDFVVIVGNFDVEVFTLGLFLLVASATGGLFAVGHCEWQD